MKKSLAVAVCRPSLFSPIANAEHHDSVDRNGYHHDGDDQRQYLRRVFGAHLGDARHPNRGLHVLAHDRICLSVRVVVGYSMVTCSSTYSETLFVFLLPLRKSGGVGRHDKKK